MHGSWIVRFFCFFFKTVTARDEICLVDSCNCDNPPAAAETLNQVGSEKQSLEQLVRDNLSTFIRSTDAIEQFSEAFAKVDSPPSAQWSKALCSRPRPSLRVEGIALLLSSPYIRLLATASF